MKTTKKVKKTISKKVSSKRKIPKPLARKKTLAIKVKTKKPIKRTVKSRTTLKKARKPRFSFKKKVLALSIIACASLALIFAPSIYNQLASGGNDQAVLGSRTGILAPNIPTNVKVVATTAASYDVTFETGLNMNDATDIFVQMSTSKNGFEPLVGTLTTYPESGKCPTQLVMTKNEKGYIGEYLPADYRDKCTWSWSEQIGSNDVYSRKRIGILGTKYQHTYRYIVNDSNLSNKLVFTDGRKVYFRVVADNSKGTAYSDVVSVNSKKNYVNTTNMKNITLVLDRKYNNGFNTYTVKYSTQNPYEMARGLVYKNINNPGSIGGEGVIPFPYSLVSIKGSFKIVEQINKSVVFGKKGDKFDFRYFHQHNKIDLGNGNELYIPIAFGPIIVTAP